MVINDRFINELSDQKSSSLSLLRNTSTFFNKLKVTNHFLLVLNTNTVYLIKG